ncbi:cell division cycle protein 123 homolog [Osmia bicornis bicornis]|uniref:cell division cycle protein 123 homolog n=1 Tax=Osmia bicornis bicornis TaxID=1437191 RepID=UPI0010F8D489|nr:cell division cycle protein 123 homolog [Osmia bicornis bicornis]XP_046142695.1 cell division cycle protein 123 homolog [Osmia bicornis bicornis]
MVNNLKPECSFASWYPQFRKDSLNATILDIPEEVLKYLEHDAFILPIEATNSGLQNPEWLDGSPVINEEQSLDFQPTFPQFSKKIQDVIDEYDAVFIKSNWSSPLDATWVAPTKTLKCKTLEEVYLLLKSSDRIAKDLSNVKNYTNNENSLTPCIILKQWRDINPCTEFRCFVVNNELTAISQRDISQYHSYNDSEKFNIQTDIKSLFMERIKDRFPLNHYSFDVVRFKKEKVKIIDFGPLDESATKGTLFTYEEIQNEIKHIPEFRFIGEEIGIQPKAPNHICVPQEVNEFFTSNESSSLLDIIQQEVASQQKESESKT